MNREKDISNLNEFYFFREFTYSKNKFINKNGQEVEIADNIVSLDKIFIVYQIKTRNQIENPSTEKENTWFDKKIVKKATKQIRDTINYLNDYDQILLDNQRGDSFNISTGDIKSAQKIVVYAATEHLSSDKKRIKFHKSDTAGIIHIISLENYEKIIKTLITPAEVFEYLGFREKIVANYPDQASLVSEGSLIGQYIIGDLEKIPDSKYSDIIERLQKDYEAWDILNIIHLFPKRVTYSTSKTDYYFILREIGKLMRDSLKLFKERFTFSMEASKENRYELPYRFAIPNLDLGFVFIPLCKDQFSNKKRGLSNLTLAHKYDSKVKKCIGIIFLYEKEDWFLIDWCFIESDWEPNAEMEKMLENNFPFRKVNPHYVNRYKML